MQKLIFIILLVSSFHALAFNQVKREELLSMLPKDLSTLSDEDNKTLVSKFKKKISSQDQNSLFLNYFSTNDVTIGLKDKKFKYVLIQANDQMVSKSAGLFARAYSNLSDDQKSKIAEELRAASHTAGRTISIDMPEEGVKLEFDNNEKKTLNSVLVWPVGGEHP